jgi:hypothetical protein
MAVAANIWINPPTEAAMNSKPSPPSQQDAPSPNEPGNKPVQTGALPGGQPGQGVNTSSSPTGQSNVDAAVAEGVEYGEHERKKR